MPELTDTEISCGLRQLSGLCSDSGRYDPTDRIPPKDVIVQAFEEELFGFGAFRNGGTLKPSEITFGAVLFSDSVRRGNGRRLAAYITKNNLGEVVEGKVFSNPNTRRNIQVWTWYLDRPALVKFLNDNKSKGRQDEENGIIYQSAAYYRGY